MLMNPNSNVNYPVFLNTDNNIFHSKKMNFSILSDNIFKLENNQNTFIITKSNNNCICHKYSGCNLLDKFELKKSDISNIFESNDDILKILI